MTNVSVVIPNLNSKETIAACIDSLLSQSLKPNVIVVENASIDGSLEFISNSYPSVDIIINQSNLGFAGGVNRGIKKAIENGADFVALLNQDAVADKYWLEKLVDCLLSNSGVGIAAAKILTIDGKQFDSTGDMYTVWGLAYPRGREELQSTIYDNHTEVFSGSGGASLYRVSMLKDIGLFDEDFFAYYEDVDISFRAQLAGWKVRYVPMAVAYHQIGSTSGKIKGFTTYQAMKNLPWLAIKNVPGKYFFRVFVRLSLVQTLFFVRAITRGHGLYAIKGIVVSIFKTPKKLLERQRIQKLKTVSDKYIWGIMTHDLPPSAKALRNLRNKWWAVTRRNSANSD